MFKRWNSYSNALTRVRKRLIFLQHWSEKFIHDRLRGIFVQSMLLILYIYANKNDNPRFTNVKFEIT